MPSFCHSSYVPLLICKQNQPQPNKSQYLPKQKPASAKDDDILPVYRETPYTVTVGQVPVDGFWSITLYNAKGFYEAPENTISLNNVTAKKNKDGTTTIYFGGDPKAPNYLRIMPGWNCMVRLYRPRKEILDGS